MTLRTYGPVAPKMSDEALIERLTTERDRYAAMLLSAEQELARRSVTETDEHESYRDLCLELERYKHECLELERYKHECLELERYKHECLELEPYKQAYLMVVDSRSWRLTRFLRVAALFARTLFRSSRTKS